MCKFSTNPTILDSGCSVLPGLERAPESLPYAPFRLHHHPTCLFTRRVCDRSVSAESVIYEAFVLMEETVWCFSALLSWRKGNVCGSLEGQRMDFPPLFLFSMQPMQKNPTLVHPSQQRPHNLQFMKKLGCQKPNLYIY